jgi:DNA-binding transcriptional ArsR family regulator
MSVSTEVLEMVSRLGGWISAQQIIDRLPEIDPQRVKFELRELVNRKQLQSRSGMVGMEYALLDTPAPAERPDYRPPIGRPLMKTAEERAATQMAVASTLLARSAPVARAADNPPLPPAENEKSIFKGQLKPPAAIPASTLDCRAAKEGDTKKRILDLLRDCSLRSMELEGALDLSSATISRHLSTLANAGLIERVKPSERHSPWRLKLPTAAPAHPAEAPADKAGMPDAKPAPAAAPEYEKLMASLFVTSAPDRNSDDGGADDVERFALWSDGSLELWLDGEQILLSAARTRRLLNYLDNICAVDIHR